MTRRRRNSLERFKALNDFVDVGMAQLSRSEIAVYLIVFRDTKPTGLARTSRTELARRGGMTERQASRALNKLIDRGAVHVIRKAAKELLYRLGAVGKERDSFESMILDILEANFEGAKEETERKVAEWQKEWDKKYPKKVETIARLPGGLSEQIAIKGRSSW